VAATFYCRQQKYSYLVPSKDKPRQRTPIVPWTKSGPG
jgi:hypothetical protein